MPAWIRGLNLHQGEPLCCCTPPAWVSDWRTTCLQQEPPHRHTAGPVLFFKIAFVIRSDLFTSEGQESACWKTTSKMLTTVFRLRRRR